MESGTTLGQRHLGLSKILQGLNATYTYDTRPQLYTMRVTHSDGSVVVLDFTYSFVHNSASNGNVASITNNRTTGRIESFAYDELNRLASAQGPPERPAAELPQQFCPVCASRLEPHQCKMVCPRCGRFTSRRQFGQSCPNTPRFTFAVGPYTITVSINASQQEI